MKPWHPAATYKSSQCFHTLGLICCHRQCDRLVNHTLVSFYLQVLDRNSPSCTDDFIIFIYSFIHSSRSQSPFLAAIMKHHNYRSGGPDADSLLDATLVQSPLSQKPGFGGEWLTAHAYQTEVPGTTAESFLETNQILLANPNLNSSHLFRADILFDSTGILQTRAQKEAALNHRGSVGTGLVQPDSINEEPEGPVDNSVATSATAEEEQEQFERRISPRHVQRTVIRRLVPRNPRLDRSLDQTCYFVASPADDESNHVKHMVVYQPHFRTEDECPWYHPPVWALAYVYESSDSNPTLSVHLLPFAGTASGVSTRLHRTVLSLLRTFTRLARPQNKQSAGEKIASRLPAELCDTGQASNAAAECDFHELPPRPLTLKDNVIPQHAVQDTYTRLKQTYAVDLIARWVEKTEPSKHVFEDLSIAAFLIELWGQMYELPDLFPGFVDIACGNGVLVYVLYREGYRGYGFDAKRRKTWDMLDTPQLLSERVCVPKPFLDVLSHDELVDAALSWPDVDGEANTGREDDKKQYSTTEYSTQAHSLFQTTPMNSRHGRRCSPPSRVRRTLYPSSRSRAAHTRSAGHATDIRQKMLNRCASRELRGNHPQ